MKVLLDFDSLIKLYVGYLVQKSIILKVASDNTRFWYSKQTDAYMWTWQEAHLLFIVFAQT